MQRQKLMLNFQNLYFQQSKLHFLTSFKQKFEKNFCSTTVIFISTYQRMLKSQKHLSKTLNTKKSKPIEITLTKKSNHLQQQQNYRSINKGQKEFNLKGISSIPLKQKSSNSAIIQNLNIRTLKFAEDKFKKQICPSYKLDWGKSYNQSNVNQQTKYQKKYLSHRSSEGQLGLLFKTSDYKKIVKEIQNTYYEPHQAIEASFNDHQTHFNSPTDAQINFIQSKVQKVQLSINSIGGVKKKIKGITKSFLRENLNHYRHERLHERNISMKQALENQQFSSLLSQTIGNIPTNQVINTKINQHFKKQQKRQFTMGDQNEKKFQNHPFQELSSRQVESIQFNEFKELHPRQSSSFQINESKQYLIRQSSSFNVNQDKPEEGTIFYKQFTPKQCASIIQQKINETKDLKLQIAELTQRLQICVEQIDFIEKNNSAEKVVELQNQIETLKYSRLAEKKHLEGRIGQLERKLFDRQLDRLIKHNKNVQTEQIQFKNAQSCTEEIRLQFNQQNKIICEKKINPSNEVKRETVSVYCQTYEFQHDQNQSYQVELIKKKYQTLEQIMQSKKKQILNKDSVIQILINKETEKISMKIGKNNFEEQRKNKLKNILSQLLAQFQEKIKLV